MQLIELFDPEMSSNERIRAAEMLYARCVQPLDFWLDALPTLPPMQIEGLMQRLGDLAAFDVDNPAGRFSLNLGRAVDRFIAMRLQVRGPWGRMEREAWFVRVSAPVYFSSHLTVAGHTSVVALMAPSPPQAASILENSCRGCKYFSNWRNAAINGTRLSIEGIHRLRDYTIPTSGSLRLDYVTYRVGTTIP